MGNGEVLTVRSFDGPSCNCVAWAVRLQGVGKIRLLPSFERDRRTHELILGSAREPLLERADSALACGSDCRAMLFHLSFQRREPGFVPALVREQLVPRAHRCIV